MLPSIATGNVASALAGEYEVANSLRFNSGSSDYLDRTLSSAGSLTKFTISFWVKRSGLSAYNTLFQAQANGGYFRLAFYNTDKFSILDDNSGVNKITSAVFRDVSAWYHIVVALDSSQSTAANRDRLYINGEEITSFSTNTSSTQNNSYRWQENSQVQNIGRHAAAGDHFNGYMSEVVVIDNSQLDPTSFGEFDEDSGIWKPKDVSGLTFGTNGFYLDFENSGSLGADVSGNGNNFTVNNLTSIDQSTDTCTNNFATLNPLSTVHTENISSMLSEGNTKYDPTGDYSIVKSTIPFPESGKWYVEIKLESSGTVNGIFGVMRIPASSTSTNSYIGYQTNEAGYAYYNGKVKRSTGGSGDTRTDLATGLASYSSGDTLAMLFNADDNEIKWYVQDSLQYTLDLSSAPHGYYANDGEWVFALSAYGTYNAYNLNFGSPSVSISSGNTDGNGYGNFEFATKGGYALCTKNLAEFG